VNLDLYKLKKKTLNFNRKVKDRPSIDILLIDIKELGYSGTGRNMVLAIMRLENGLNNKSTGQKCYGTTFSWVL
jgi:hypothetical protein